MLRYIRILLSSLVLTTSLAGSVTADCPVGDLNGDCQVNLQDLGLLAEQWLVPPGSPPGSSADLNGDDEIGVADFAVLAKDWCRVGIPLVINEVMASNSTGIQDPQGQYDDWIEIHNTSDEAIDVGGMYLTDDLDNPTMWRIPDDNPSATSIPANGYLLIWADDDTTSPGLHANFKLDSAGEQIGLFDSNGSTLIDAISFGDQATDISYGRYPNAGNNLRYMAFPTPGAENSGIYPGFVADTKFSHERGFYDAPFSVTITTETEGAVIRYTLDGTEPYQTGGRFPTGKVYTGPIRITKTTCLRAIAMKYGWKSSNTDTHTYIFIDDVIEQADMSTAITQDPVWGPQMKDALLEIPTISLVTPYTIPDEPIQSPPEVPTSIEMIFPDGTKGFQANACVERFGGQYTVYPKQALRVSFKSIYGPSRLEFDLFGDTPYGGDDASDSFNQIILRNGSHDSLFHGGYPHSKGTYVRNRYCFDRQIEMGHLSLRGRFVHMYLNGVYWGQYHLMERPTADYMATYLGGDEEDYDIMKGRSGIFVAEGNRVAWNYMVANTNNYEIVQEYLDIDNYIDYMLLNFYGGNDHDWYPHHNWIAGRRREAGSKFIFFMWDNDFLMRRLNGNTIDNGGPGNMLGSLIRHEDFKMRLADRAQKHFFNDGMLTPARVQADFTELTNRIARTIIPECARWSAEGSGGTYTPDSLQQYVDWIKFDHGNFRTDIVVQQMRDAGLFPSIDAPTFSHHGGEVPSGFDLTMDAPRGTIWYTIDGHDPRLPGGAVNTSHADAYWKAVKLTKTTHVKARALSGGTWSALNEAIFAIGPVAENLRITEIMYHPQDTNDPNHPNEEFIELQNIGIETINLNLVRFTNGVDFTFPSMELAAGEYVLVVEDTNAFEAQYGPGLNIAGQYSGNLRNGGERVELQDAAGQTILNFRYRDGWYDITDGMGFSLTVKEPVNTEPNAWNDKSTWRPSASIGGSPGWDDSDEIPALGSVKINELLAHSHATASDWIELHNTTSEPIHIGGWFLSDDNDDLMKYEIADGTWIDPCHYIVFYQNEHFGNIADPGCHSSFALSENGETLYLHSGRDGILTGYNEEEKFDASETGVAFGRYRKSTGTYNFVAMSENTPGSANAYPRVGPIVINEIMYHPQNNGDAEYVELLNISGGSIDLEEWDNEQSKFVPWRFADEGGISFDFPLGTTMAAGEHILLVRNLTAFESEFGAVGSVQVFEWELGKLDNGSEKIQLSKPGDDVEGERYYIRVDRVNYSDGSHPIGNDHWPTEADSNGLALQKKEPLSNYGNDVISWQASGPTPGQ